MNLIISLPICASQFISYPTRPTNNLLLDITNIVQFKIIHLGTLTVTLCIYVLFNYHQYLRTADVSTKMQVVWMVYPLRRHLKSFPWDCRFCIGYIASIYCTNSFYFFTFILEVKTIVRWLRQYTEYVILIICIPQLVPGHFRSIRGSEEFLDALPDVLCMFYFVSV